MAKIRFGIACSALVLLASACGQATLSTDNASTSQDESSIDANESNETSQADEHEDEPTTEVENEDETTVTEEEIEAYELAAAADDVEVRLVDAPLASAGGSSVIRAEVLGVDGDIVDLPALSVIGPGVVFTSVPHGCEVSDGGVDCVSDTFLFRDSDDIPVNETMTLQFDFEYSVPADIEFPLVFELTATSYMNPVENDPDPSNNIITVEVEAG